MGFEKMTGNPGSPIRVQLGEKVPPEVHGVLDRAFTILERYWFEKGAFDSEGREKTFTYANTGNNGKRILMTVKFEEL